MKAIMVMFDSLNRHLLPPYGCEWVHAPNFQRLAEKTVTFDHSWVGSMPCMPARRELHTGRYNFLHRSWGPLEPFDDSMPEILKKKGIYTHLVTDHQHYWEDGGGNYSTRFSTFETSRGQEGDPWKGEVQDPEIPEIVPGKNHIRQDWINRQYIQQEADFPQAQTFAKGLDFIDKNHDQDNWYLQIETFDPHEPFYAPQAYLDLYPHTYDGSHFDWPGYHRIAETAEEVEHCRYQYAALVSMCDAYLGKVLDKMDALNLWEDTMLIVNTDHGYLLGEHGWWSKVVMPFYNEVARMPLFIWDPRCKRSGERCESLVQTIDLAPTLLEYFHVDIPSDMLGKPLRKTIASNKAVRDAALFGVHGGHVNCTNGRYVYMRSPISDSNEPLYNYTLMPTHMKSFFSLEELKSVKLAEPFRFTKGLKTMRVNAQFKFNDFKTVLYDLHNDPGQMNPIHDPFVEEEMLAHMVRLMHENEAPPEQYERLGLQSPAERD